MNNAIILFSNQDSPEEQDCQEALKQLEQIKDETDAIGIKFVKTMDKAFVTWSCFSSMRVDLLKNTLS